LSPFWWKVDMKMSVRLRRGKKDKLSQKLSFISKTKMCQNPLEIYL